MKSKIKKLLLLPRFLRVKTYVNYDIIFFKNPSNNLLLVFLFGDKP